MGRKLCVAITSVACVVFMLPIAIAEEHPDNAVTSSRNAFAPVTLSLSDRVKISRSSSIVHDTPVEYCLHDSSAHPPAPIDYPNSVSHDPGHPAKPRREKPGDINVRDCPPERYSLENIVRAGNPKHVAWWARCSLNENYSVWYVGGGTPWILPRQARSRTSQEGTWGADYNGLLQLRRVWLKWSCDRTQGGLGAYATDRESLF